MGEIFWLAPLSEHDRLRFELEHDRGKIGRVCVQLESEVGGEYRAIVRYDNAHGFCHRDRIRPDGSVEKTALDLAPADLATYAHGDLRENWRKYRAWYEDAWRNRR